jgi:hypothetical protein
VDGYHLRQALRKARLSSIEESSLVTGILLLVTGALMAMINDDLGGPAGALGRIGLGVLGVCALARAAGSIERTFRGRCRS